IGHEWVIGVPGEVNGKRKRKGKGGSGYAPARPARLVAADAPPPVPQRFCETKDAFGSADEDGLRMLAALETLTSLEPDYTEDLAAEACVTIIEVAGEDILHGLDNGAEDAAGMPPAPD